ncbi:uncharacterized protein LOC125823854 [Solanum verrucosum]|uniref:uncharacterized protein LOC125823854 n=1 Tax=Solanum verrucosum TaxID=315347 RepID=UPI0020D17947|nr:uncharacterized protein LOC125823854 [Solanum verrucosum]
MPRMGEYKSNSDGASKGNPGPSSCAFCIRNDQRDLIYVEGKRIGIANNLVAEVVALRMAVKNMVDGSWDIPWEVSLEIRRIQELMKGMEVVIEHTFREGNKVADFLANLVFSFEGTEIISFNTFQDLPKEAKTLLNMDKSQTPNLRIKQFQNENFRIEGG